MSFQKVLLYFSLLPLISCLAGIKASDKSDINISSSFIYHHKSIFMEGESIFINTHPNKTITWEVLDYTSISIAHGITNNGVASLGKLPIGYYEIFWKPKNTKLTHKISFGVLSKLKRETPNNSPVGVDAAISSFYSGKDRQIVSNLCVLAGINWIRDRFIWSEIEPIRRSFLYPNKYDESIKIQSFFGLNILTVNQTSPKWSGSDSRRFPSDMRFVFDFYKAMAQRWKGKVKSFEPWNEPELEGFGGHIGSEIASFQKSAYLGLKAGNHDIKVALSPFARTSPSIFDDLKNNKVHPYFDTLNFHHYDSTETYSKMYSKFRTFAEGKPLWVTEANIPVQWSGDQKKKEPTDSDLKIQAERVATIYSTSLFEGAEVTFYFLLPSYSEGKTQFGLLRDDLTPRPAFLSLAAVGRLLVSAQPLGKLKQSNSNIHAFLFRSWPDGIESDVLVSWITSGTANIKLPVKPKKSFDHIGRNIRNVDKNLNMRLSAAPVFSVFPKNSWKKSFINTPPTKYKQSSSKNLPSSVIFHAEWPKNRVNLDKSAYQISFNKTEMIPVFIYNFGLKTVQGQLKIISDKSCSTNLIKNLKLLPGERKKLFLETECHDDLNSSIKKIILVGEFGLLSKSTLSLRLISDKSN